MCKVLWTVYRIFYYAVCKVSYPMQTQILRSITWDVMHRVSENYPVLLYNVIDYSSCTRAHISEQILF